MCACMHCVCAAMCVRVQLLVEAIAPPPHAQAGITGSCETLDQDVGN